MIIVNSILKYSLQTVVLIFFLCVVLLSGCRSNSGSDDSSIIDDAAGESGQGLFYKAEVIPFPELPMGFEEINNITLAGDIVYFTASIDNPSDSEPAKSLKSTAIFSMDLDGTNLRKLPEYSTEAAPPPEATIGGLFIIAMHADEHGNIWIVETEGYYISEEPDIFRDAGSTFTIRKLDIDGTELLSADISDFAKSIDGFYISMFTVDDNGFIFIGCSYILADETTIYVLDSDFKVLFDIVVPVWHNPFIHTSDNSVAFLRQQNNERYVQIIDINRKTLGESIHLPETVFEVFSGYNDFLILYMDNAGLYGLSGDSGEAVRILGWIDAGVVSERLENISFLHDGRIFLTKSTPVHGSWDYKYEIILLTKTESHDNEQREALSEKTELTLGTLRLSPLLQKAILQFNDTSTTYYISVINYSSNTTPDDIDGALLRFTTEITAGKIPDILNLATIPFDRLIALGLLEDLYPYLDSDPELSRDSLMESVLKAHEINEKLFMINQSFSVITIIGNSSILGEYPGWTVEEFIAVLDANPQADIPFGSGFSKHDFLFRLLLLNLYEYIDMGSRTADFNNRDFILLLELINSFPSEIDVLSYDPLYNSELKAEGRQIMDTFNVRLQDLETQRESFGGDIVFKGWPTADRSGHRFIGYDGVAITSKATDKDGAWEFVRTLLMEEHQRDLVWSFPINKVVFSERILEDMEPYSYYMQNGQIITVEPTQEDADEIIALINSTTKITAHGIFYTLGNIIIESASDFFNGHITAEDAARIIQNRVSIFLAEQG